jgi:hypothetical protein
MRWIMPLRDRFGVSVFGLHASAGVADAFRLPAKSCRLPWYQKLVELWDRQDWEFCQFGYSVSLRPATFAPP